MVMINRATKEITFKIVYYGPGLGGKTTNLEYIYASTNPDRKGKLLTVATETDRTLFFDFMPLELGTIRGMKVRVQLYTVPGQVFYDATRRIVLRGSDGVVFVADSQAIMMDADLESLENLRQNLKLNNLDGEAIPLVIQFNKQDLPNLSPVEEMQAKLNWRGVPHFLSVATVGTGVHETLKKIIELVIRRLQGQEAEVVGRAKTVRREPEPAPPAAAPAVEIPAPEAPVQAEAEAALPEPEPEMAPAAPAHAEAEQAHPEPEPEPVPVPEEEAEPLPLPLPAQVEAAQSDEAGEVELELEPTPALDDEIEAAPLPAGEEQAAPAASSEALVSDLRLRFQYFADRLQALSDEAEEIKAALEALERRVSD